MRLVLEKQARSELVLIFKEWRKRNKTSYARMMGIISAIISMLLIPFDYILFPSSFIFYLPFRLSMALIFSLIALYAGMLVGFAKPSKMRDSALLLSVPLIFEVVYHFFLFRSYGSLDPNEAKIVLIGNFLVIIFLPLFIYQFFEEQYLFQTTGILFLMSCMLVDKGFVIDGSLLVIAHWCTFLFCFLHRRAFASNLYMNHKNVVKFVPTNIAHEISISGLSEDISNRFRPEYKFTVCLIADWRGSLEITQNNTPNRITRYFEIYYDLINDRLRALLPEGGYYMGWTADELIVLFYAETELDESKAAEASVRFLSDFVGDLRIKILSELKFDLRYDIGISCGVDLLGLQGPKHDKKTTLIGTVPCNAKRLETQAKQLRKSNPDQSEPFVVIDKKFHSAARTFFDKRFVELKEFKADCQDIAGQTVYVWNTRKEHVGNDSGRGAA